MFSITHQKARLFLQAISDHLLEPEEKTALDKHLAECKECNNYATGLFSLEKDLRKIMHAEWDNQKPNLNLQAIVNPSPIKLFWGNFTGQSGVLGKATIVVALLLSYFIISNIFGIQLPITGDETATTLPTPDGLTSIYSTSPTPSVQSSPIGLTTQACNTTTYLVRENDTLKSIALEYGTTQEAISEYNNLGSTTVFSGMELVIPLCKNPPSHTATIPEGMITITPIRVTIFPTQPE